MKKLNLFLPALLAVILLVSSCKPEKKVVILLNKTSLELPALESERLEFSITPSETDTTGITWSSDNENVAKVDETGLVTAVAEGNAKITVTIGTVSASCSVTVTKALPTVSRNAVLIEQFTSVFCGPCPGASAIIQGAMKEVGEKALLVCHHVGYEEDIYTVSASRPLMFLYGGGGGTPSAMLNRSVIKGKYPPFHAAYVTATMLKKQLNRPSYVSIDMNLTFNSADKSIKVDVSGELLRDLPNAKINVYLIQDSIVGQQYVATNENNYPHRNVMRATLTTSAMGDNIGVQKGKFTKTYQYTIPDNITGTKNIAVPTNINNMYVVAFVADYIDTTTASAKKSEIHNVVMKKIQ